jgi:uncharacterized ion transporter superfamily protein YfcC
MTGIGKKFKVPHAFALLTILILVCSIASYIVPSGKYDEKVIKVGDSTRTVLIPGSFKYIPKEYSFKKMIIGDEVNKKFAAPTSILQFLSAIPKGMLGASQIIFFIFIVGGAFGVLVETGTITAVLQGLIRKFENKGFFLVAVLMIITGIAGSCFGLIEELLPLIPVFLIMAIRLGYDRIFGVCLVYLSATVGFSAATTNPFTLQVAQNIAEIPLYSGILFRVIFFISAMAIFITYVYFYGRRIKFNKSKSYLGEEGFTLKQSDIKHVELRHRHIIIVIVSFIIFALIMYGSQKYGWWFTEMSGGFILMALVAAGISRFSIEQTTRAFSKGFEGMLIAALIVGFAKGIEVVLSEAQIIDTIIYYAATILSGFSTYLAAEGMLIFQTMLNFFIPSGSGQAAVTMPLMAPLSDVLNVTRQTAVLAFTCGDGFSNFIIPTSGLLMAVLTIADIPYEKWFKFVAPLFIIMMLLSGIFIAISVAIHY